VVPLKRADDQQLFWRLRPPPPVTGSFLLQHGISVSSISVRRASGAPPYCPQFATRLTASGQYQLCHRTQAQKPLSGIVKSVQHYRSRS
jgi:hypothetical protein